MAKLNEIEKEREQEIYQSYLCNALLDKVCETMNKKNISNTQLATLMGISKSEVSRLLSNNRNLTVKMVARIFYALGEKVKITTQSEFSSLETKKLVPVVGWDIRSFRINSSLTDMHNPLMSQTPVHLIGKEYAKRIRPAS